MTRFITFLCALVFASGTHADVPRVVADIAPVHSLVARVMLGVGSPTLLIEPTATPHSYALRPSKAAALESADIVFVTSMALTPWIDAPLRSLAQNADVIELMETARIIKYEFRELEGESDGHDHDHDHNEETYDPHGWLGLDNVTNWLEYIAIALMEMDPENASTYEQNGRDAIEEMIVLSEGIVPQMRDIRKKRYMVLHDGFQYFDRMFGPQFMGAIALGDASAPSPARIAKARAVLKARGVACVFTEPQQNDRLVQVVIEGQPIKTGTLDAIGARLSPGPYLYRELMQGISDSFYECLKD